MASIHNKFSAIRKYVISTCPVCSRIGKTAEYISKEEQSCVKRRTAIFVFHINLDENKMKII